MILNREELQIIRELIMKMKEESNFLDDLDLLDAFYYLNKSYNILDYKLSYEERLNWMKGNKS